MNSYATIAYKVLKEVRQPLSARQILETAYRLQLVPSGLYGKTQHKTLHARLAEDIRRFRANSAFARIAAGRFCLRADLSGFQARGKPEYFAPARADQLKNFFVLCFKRTDMTNDLISEWANLPSRAFYDLLVSVTGMSDVLYVRVILVVKRRAEILVHHVPHTRFGEALEGEASIGLVGFLKREDRSLFSTDQFGVEEAAARILSEQLYLPISAISELELAHAIDRAVCVRCDSNPLLGNALAVMLIYDCKPNSEADRRLSEIERSTWHSDSLVLNETLDPWSQHLIATKALASMLQTPAV